MLRDISGNQLCVGHCRLLRLAPQCLHSPIKEYIVSFARCVLVLKQKDEVNLAEEGEKVFPHSSCKVTD